MKTARIATILVLFLLGCAGGGGGGAAKESTGVSHSLLAAGGKVGAIDIALDPALNDEQRQVITQYTAVERLEAQLRQALQARSAWSPEGELRLAVTLDDFRLRSNSANVWLGSMAGADYLGVEVAVEQQGQVVKTFATDTSSIQGGLMMPGRGQRLDRLVAELAKRIADGV